MVVVNPVESSVSNGSAIQQPNQQSGLGLGQQLSFAGNDTR